MCAVCFFLYLTHPPINTELVFNHLCVRSPLRAPSFFTLDEGTVDFSNKPLCQGCNAHPRARAHVCCKSGVNARSRRGSLLAHVAPPTAQEATPPGSWQRGCCGNRSRNEADDGWSLFTLRAACIILSPAPSQNLPVFVFVHLYILSSSETSSSFLSSWGKHSWRGGRASWRVRE